MCHSNLCVILNPFPVMSFFLDWRLPQMDKKYRCSYCVIRSCDTKRELSLSLSLVSFLGTKSWWKRLFESPRMYRKNEITQFLLRKNETLVKRKYCILKRSRTIQKLNLLTTRVFVLTFSIHIFAYEISVLQLLFRR